MCIFVILQANEAKIIKLPCLCPACVVSGFVPCPCFIVPKLQSGLAHLLKVSYRAPFQLCHARTSLAQFTPLLISSREGKTCCCLLAWEGEEIADEYPINDSINIAFIGQDFLQATQLIRTRLRMNCFLNRMKVNFDSESPIYTSKGWNMAWIIKLYTWD